LVSILELDMDSSLANLACIQGLVQLAS